MAFGKGTKESEVSMATLAYDVAYRDDAESWREPGPIGDAFSKEAKRQCRLVQREWSSKRFGAA
jgi:hypothetical protein